MPNFTYATLTDAQDALLARLYDDGVAGQPVAQYWTRDECTLYICEALRAWNAYTGFWRNDFTFDIDTFANNGSSWYDLTTQTNSLRPFTVTDHYLANLITYHLLEPQTGTPAVWTGSNQFSLSGILNAITRRQNDCLTQTGVTVTQSTVAAAIQRRTLLPDTTLDIRRVSWLPVTGLGYSATPLRQSDLWELQAFNAVWTAAGPGAPAQWLESSEPPPAFDVDIIPAVPGKYDVLAVNSGAASNATSAQTLSVPDDWSWVVKWGALADLLSKEANAKDVMRAKYCAARFAQDCQIMMNSPALLGLQMNGLPLFVDAARNGDDFNPNWQAQTPATPSTCYQSGLNLLAFPNPDAIYGILASVIQNAPVPTTGADYIQIARGDFDAMIGEAQHIAMFKVAGNEFSQTIGLHQEFLNQAGIYNKKLKEMGQFPMDMRDISQRESRRNPRMAAR